MSKTTKPTIDELVKLCRSNKIEYLKAYGYELKFHPLAFIEVSNSSDKLAVVDNVNDIKGTTNAPNEQAADEEDELYWST